MREVSARSAMGEKIAAMADSDQRGDWPGLPGCIRLNASRVELGLILQRSAAAVTIRNL